MKVYIVTKQVVDSELTTHNVYDTCFIDADECLKYVSEQLEKGNKVKYEIKKFDVLQSRPIINPATPTLPYNKGFCSSWDDCTNPQKDCINCPVMGKSNECISTTTTQIMGDYVPLFYQGQVVKHKDGITKFPSGSMVATIESVIKDCMSSRMYYKFVNDVTLMPVSVGNKTLIGA